MILLENDVPFDEIQKVLSNKNIGTTQIYAKISIKRLRKMWIMYLTEFYVKYLE